MAGNGNGIAWKLFAAMVTVNVMLAGVGVKMVLDLSAQMQSLTAEMAGLQATLAVRIEKADAEHAEFSRIDRELEARIERLRDRTRGGG